jgi:probable addiction module antidote protein
MTITTLPYDVAATLRTPEEMAAYLEACIEEADGDAAFIAKALGDIARAQGMTEIARQTGLSRESLYKALSGERSPSFDTILKVVSALGLKLSAGVRDEAGNDCGGEGKEYQSARSGCAAEKCQGRE